MSLSHAVLKNIIDKQGKIDLRKDGNAQKQEGLAMAEPPRSRVLGNYPVELITAGNHTLGQVVIDNDITVLFQVRDPVGPWPEIDTDCLLCEIVNIRGCADEVCPPIKANDPNASCSDAILDCTRQKCANQCGAGPGGSGGIIVIA